ncbi:glycoside hydrolase/deacetylase [Tothia fuscella]|uniref:Glycoside hydrolase/deacetylase n=1 Tax=Tothia fuscella TaxID=1048955 RepID=A0A9P4NEI9_9PEZI|nr:glycoside hydrolase/deacetylase [Tothia fuscella]
MRLSAALALSLITLPTLINAHGDIQGAPRIFGLRDVAGLRQRVAHLGSVGTIERATPFPDLETRQSRTNCGPRVGSCAAGLCCSSAGFCGTGKDYCDAPDCQFQYGPACDANSNPAGPSTSKIARSKLGKIDYGGEGIYNCVTPGTVAITFDDGPYIYTSGILDLLQKVNGRATFFITGNNIGKGQIDNAAYPWANIIKRMHAEGHQIASHTWSHQDLSNITSAQRKDQMYKNEMALRNILGFFPTYMRPPYSSCTAASGCQSDLAALGYHITYFDLDTEDYLNISPLQVQVPKDNFLGNLSMNANGQGDWLAIAHDIHEQTARNLTEYMLAVLVWKGYKAVTVGECLGDAKENWYRASSGGGLFTSSGGVAPPSATAVPSSPVGSVPVVPAAPPKPVTGISFEGNCGGSTGLTCQGSSFGNCCSVNGWCGSTPAYCDNGCQGGFGSCGSSIGGPAPTSSPIPTNGPAKGKVSLDGACGGSGGQICVGSTFGDCCSHAGWCGKTADYCKSGCQLGFGTCG